MQFSEGSWKLELSPLRIFVCDTYSEQGLGFFTSSVEYEFPAFEHGKLGLKFYPLVPTSGSKPVHAVGRELRLARAETPIRTTGSSASSALLHSCPIATSTKITAGSTS